MVEGNGADFIRQPSSLRAAISPRAEESPRGVTTLPNPREVDRGQLLLALHDESQVLDRVQKLEQFDVKIDRSIKRLMQAKTMKQMYRQGCGAAYFRCGA